MLVPETYNVTSVRVDKNGLLQLYIVCIHLELEHLEQLQDASHITTIARGGQSVAQQASPLQPYDSCLHHGRSW